MSTHGCVDRKTKLCRHIDCEDSYMKLVQKNELLSQVVRIPIRRMSQVSQFIWLFLHLDKMVVNKNEKESS